MCYISAVSIANILNFKKIMKMDLSLFCKRILHCNASHWAFLPFTMWHIKRNELSSPEWLCWHLLWLVNAMVLDIHVPGWMHNHRRIKIDVVFFFFRKARSWLLFHKTEITCKSINNSISMFKPQWGYHNHATKPFWSHSDTHENAHS